MAVLVTACAKQPEVKTFYPPQPQPPRLQFLKAIGSENDLKSNNLAQMLTGGVDGVDLRRAFGVSMNARSIFVADPSDTIASVAEFNLESKKAIYLDRGFGKPIDVFVADDGRRYIADTKLNRIIALDSKNQVVRNYVSKAENFRPTSVYAKDDRVYTTDIKNNVVRVFDKNSGEEIQVIGQDENMGWPNDIVIDNQDRLLVVESGRARVSIFSEDGTFLSSFGRPGDRASNFARPKSIAVDKNGNMYVVDAAFQNVQIFNKEGLYRMHFGGTSTDPEGMILPAGIAINYDIVPYFQQYAAPGFKIEYIVAVSNQGSPRTPWSKINFYGFGKMEGADYSAYED